ncbi:MAG: hypothetical protein K8T20_17815 [Planctomycetes bacterium]|nr:hypothetical protein [Planctomycetota bacterium]
MTPISKWSLQLGAAVLCSVFAFASPSFAGDDCCGGGECTDKPVVAATPQECFTAAATAIGKNDKKALAAQLSAKSIEVATKKGDALKETLGKDAEMQKKMGLTADQVKEMSGSDLILTCMITEVKAAVAKAMEKDGCCDEKGAAADKKAPSMEIKDVKIEGDKATATCPIGRPLAFVKENGAWKMDISAMLEKGCDDKGGCCGDKAHE